MELRFKKTALAALLGLSVAGVANAAGFTPACTPEAVTIPCEATAWDLGVDLLWVQPSKDDINYWYTENNVINNVFVQNRHYVDPDYDFGFRLEGSYHFGTGKDLTLNWTYFDQNNSNSVVDYNNTYNLTGPFTVYGKDDINFNEVNLELGQHFDVGEKVDLRLHMGVQYVSIDDDLTTSFVPYNQDYTARATWSSDFTGIGPRFGMEFWYHLGSGFSIVGRAAGAVLVGELDSSFYAQGGVFGEYQGRDNVTRFNNGSDRRTVVPTAQTKLGVNYAHQMSQGTVSVELGYMVNGYFHTVLFPNLADPFRNSASNFGLNGGYLTLKYVSA